MVYVIRLGIFLIKGIEKKYYEGVEKKRKENTWHFVYCVSISFLNRIGNDTVKCKMTQKDKKKVIT